MHFDLSYIETAALTRLLRDKIDNDRYPLSPRIRALQGILDADIVGDRIERPA